MNNNFNCMIYFNLRKKYRAVCYAETVRVLFLYLIINPHLIDETYFLFGYNIPKYIREIFARDSFLLKRKKKGYLFSLFNIIRCWICLPVIYFFRKLNNIPAYGQDHLKFGRFCVNRSSEFYLLEDGLGNYINPIKILKLKNNHRLIFFCKTIYNFFRSAMDYSFGLSRSVKRIYLTGIKPVPECLLDKVEIFSIEDCWNRLLDDQKMYIKNIFIQKKYSFPKEIDVLLLTTCFSEDGFMSEEEKVAMYKCLVRELAPKELVIKPHPREMTDYRQVFKGALIMEKDIPFELCVLIYEISIKTIISVGSTSASFGQDHKCRRVIYEEDYIYHFRK